MQAGGICQPNAIIVPKIEKEPPDFRQGNSVPFFPLKVNGITLSTNLETSLFPVSLVLWLTKMHAFFCVWLCVVCDPNWYLYLLHEKEKQYSRTICVKAIYFLQSGILSLLHF